MDALRDAASAFIIATIHLVEVVRGASAIEASGALPAAIRDGIAKWFTDYLTWMSTSKNGRDERDAKNNHGTCWVMQAAEFARYTGNAEITGFCRERFKTVLLAQMAADGSYPQELRRTKPYAYSLFNLETMTTACQILSSAGDLWHYELPDGRGMRKAAAFMYPYIADKSKWPYLPDVMYYDQWPVRQVLLLFAGLAFGENRYQDLGSSVGRSQNILCRESTFARGVVDQVFGELLSPGFAPSPAPKDCCRLAE